jgi:hypothetical protein
MTLRGGVVDAPTVQIGYNGTSQDYPGTVAATLDMLGGTLNTSQILLQHCGGLTLHADYANDLPLQIVGGTLDLTNHALRVDAAHGSLNVTSGYVIAATADVGSLGAGAYTQDGGDMAATSLTLGRTATGVGSYTLTGHSVSGSNKMNPALDVSTMVIGDAGQGSAVINWGIATVADSLILGKSSTGTGSLTLGRAADPNAKATVTVGRLIVGGAGSGNLVLGDPTNRVNVSERMQFGPRSSLTAVTGATVALNGATLSIASTNAASLADLSKVGFLATGNCQVEAASSDYGPAEQGFVNNFALGGLSINTQANGSVAGRATFVNESANQASGAEAVYLNSLSIGPGGTFDLGGANVYYRSAVDPTAILQLFPADANLDGQVDVVDLGTLAKYYGTAYGATWATADFNGDGAVDVIDLGILAKFYDSHTVPAGASVPEPCCLTLLLAGALGLRRR